MADENAQGRVDSPSVASSDDMSWMVDEQAVEACAPFQTAHEKQGSSAYVGAACHVVPYLVVSASLEATSVPMEFETTLDEFEATSV
jgi:hypothetical protein